MEIGRGYSVIGIILAIFSVILSVWYRESVMVVLSVFALLFCIIARKHCTDKVCLYTLVVSLITLIVTLVLSFCVSHSILVEDMGFSNNVWIYATSILHTAAVVPLTLLSFFVIASAFNSSFNWSLVSALCVFVGLGLQTPGYGLLFFLQRADIDAGIMTNAYVLYGLTLTMMVLIAAALLIRHVFKKNQYLITSNGLEVRDEP